MLSAAKHLEGGGTMPGEILRLFAEGGGAQLTHWKIPEDDAGRKTFQRALMPSDWPDTEMAATLLLANKDLVKERHGVSAWTAFLALHNRSRVGRMPLVPLTRRFIETL
jgi:hypothetical protein